MAGIAGALALGLCAPPGAHADLNEGLIAFWNFDEGGGWVVHDVSGNGNDGLNDGGTWVPGVSGTGMEILGTAIVQNIPETFDDGVTDALSLSVWVCWHGPGTASSYIFDGRAAGAGLSRYGILLGITRETQQVRLQLLCPPDDSQYTTLTSEGVVPVGVWTHIAGVFDLGAGALTVYLNGVPDASVPAAHAYCGTFITAAIGNNRWAPGDLQWAPLNGRIDEFRLYDRPLTPEEIEELAAGGGTPAPETTWGALKRLFR